MDLDTCVTTKALLADFWYEGFKGFSVLIHSSGLFVLKLQERFFLVFSFKVLCDFFFSCYLFVLGGFHFL